ncbi:unnamed protein product [Euphydryas editha]|uniref:Uncharacterized protein n=1 Tax=Euphydryas editha TaxID=104508 RepID=A0AAU9V667_EUPED|nr:unnamed protein product [Euphydryas editha]
MSTLYNVTDFECAGDEVLVESSPPASPDMAARLAAPSQGAGTGGASPSDVRELIVIPDSIHLQHAIQQVSSTVVEVNGDSSGHSSPTTETQHAYIVTIDNAWDQESLHIKSETQSDEESKC